MAKYVVTKENKITATIPILSSVLALYACIKLFLLLSKKTGIATAGRIQAWKACEKTIKAGGRSSKKMVPKANNIAVKINHRDCFE